MKVQVVRTNDDYVLNVRYTDELLEDGTLTSEADLDEAEKVMRQGARFYLKNADTYLRAL